MKIDGSQHLRNIQFYKRAMEVHQHPQKKDEKYDQVQISNEAKHLQQNPVSAGRQAKVEELRQRIKNGTYEINYERVAAKFQEYWTDIEGRGRK